MCTLSWLPQPSGYFLCFNRDERRTRAPGAPPSLHRADGLRFAAPIDGDFGGTWIGVNEAGLSVSLLNRYEDSPVDPAGGTVSRGLLVKALLTSSSLDELARRVAGDDLGRYQPFTLCAAAPGLPLAIYDWTGERLLAAAHEAPGMVRTSSGRDQREAELIRGQVWKTLATTRTAIEAGTLTEFHRSHRPEKGPFSVCMHREEARTQSLCTVAVSDLGIELGYFAGPPCESPPFSSVRLERHPDRADGQAL